MDGLGAAATTGSLVVGVTGHRNLREADLDTLRAQVRAFLLGLASRYPLLPVTVLSSLAEGGDQLAAEVALDLGLRVIAPLPVPPDSYRQDFDDPAALELFQRQLDRIDCLVLPVPSGCDPMDAATPGPARDLQYARAGIFISSHCHILLALWDGRETELLGGTAQVVTFHLQGDMPGPVERRRAALGMLGLDEETLVYHVPTARRDGEPLPMRLACWLTSDQGLVEHAEIPAAFDVMFRRHAEFNRDCASHGPGPLAPSSRDADECPIEAGFRVADALATLYQRRVSRVLALTYLLAAAMGFALILYSESASQDVMIYLFLLFFLAGFLVAGLARRREWHRKYLDYRALAEGLRVQSFWRRAGIVDLSTPSFAHDNFLQKQDVELGWIRNIMRGATLDGMLRPTLTGSAQVAAVIEEWIGTPESGGQLNYYGVTASRRTRVHRRAQWLGDACLWAGISISVLLALYARRLDDGAQALLVATMGVLSVAAAVHEAYAYKKADKELIKQYRFMHRIFAAARRKLTASASLADQRQILRTLGEAALAEHAEWTLMHRERPLEHSRI